ncbi:TlpA disulfide reductase family protein [Ferrimonas marina]|uniref:Thiol-disulfide isomerase or thioredoxin n=1 Tax=Ferrimonas marina TaxID=299255 RepID=A0A1M5NRM2_9GAMM|nr:TlpA disulfide reductase family protein [Ferrimonas marina]SHG92192.1 Thiol-disulfide isomerase or thioredoxin [Ferrimonas marina]
MQNPLRGALAALLLTPLMLAAEPAPDFAITELDTTVHELSQERLVYLDFWASWCGPCRHSFPFMNELKAKFEDKGLTVVAVNVDVEPADAEPFLAKYPADFTLHYDPEGAIAEAYAVPGMPTSYLIRNGEILERHIGFRKSQTQALFDEIEGYLP